MPKLSKTRSRIGSYLNALGLLLSIGAVSAAPPPSTPGKGIHENQPAPPDQFTEHLERASLEDVRTAIASGLDPNATTSVRNYWLYSHPIEAPAWMDPGTTMLNFAIGRRRFDVAALLVELGADVNKPNATPEASAPLQTLAQITSACCLVSEGGDAARRKLDEAAAELATVLLSHGAVLDARDAVGYSAVDYAAMGDSAPVLARLIAAGASMEARKPRRTQRVPPGQSLDDNPFYGLPGATPLILAVHMRARRTTSWLIEHHANLNTATDDGLTPLLIAVAATDGDAVRELLANGADVNQAAPGMMAPYNLAPVRVAQVLVDNGNVLALDIVPLLTAHGAKLDLATRASNAVRRTFYHCCYLPISH
jgi:ankyrin repeat protein